MTAIAQVNNTAPLSPNKDDILAHLKWLAEPMMATEPKAQIEIAYESTLGTGANSARLFFIENLEAAATFAVNRNRAGVNVYVGASLKHPRTGQTQRTKEEDVYVATAVPVDIDEDTDKAVSKYVGALGEADLTVTTGTVPETRKQLWKRLQEPLYDVQQFEDAFASLVDYVGGDDNAKGPARLMRLAGTVSYPTGEKQKRGYVTELTHLTCFPGEPVTAQRLLTLLPAGVQPSTSAIKRNAAGLVIDGRNEYWRDIVYAQIKDFHETHHRHPLEDDIWSTALQTFQKGCDGAPGWTEAELKKRLRTTLRNLKAEAPTGAPVMTLVSATDFLREDIPPRDWIAQRIALRGHVSMIIGAGGAGKSLFSLHLGCAIAAGSEWGGFVIPKPARVMMLNAEDDLTEQRRRLLAMDISGNDLVQKVNGRLLMPPVVEDLTVVKMDKATGRQLATPLVSALVDVIRAQQIDVLIVDPFAETLAGDENSADAVREAMKIWRDRIARACNISVILVHHTPKNSEDMAGNANAARGSGAITNATRAAWTVMTMTSKEAEVLGVEEHDRHKYLRADDAKHNYGLLSGRAKWFEKVSVCLDNGSVDLPSDYVGVIRPWTSPEPLAQFSDAEINRLLDDIERGILVDGRRRPIIKHHAGKDRCLHNFIAARLSCSEAMAKSIGEAMIKSGLLVIGKVRDEFESRDATSGVIVNNNKRPGCVANPFGDDE